LDIELRAVSSLLVMDESFARDDERCRGVHDVLSGGDDVELALAAKGGDLFSVDVSGRVDLRVLVGDVPEDERPRRAERSVRDLLLRVPTGRLLVAPLEHWDPRELEKPAFTVVEVPRGTHALECWLLPAKEEPLPPVHARVEKIVSVVGVIGIVLFAAGVVGAFGAWFMHHGAAALAIVASVSAYWTTAIVAVKHLRAKHGAPPATKRVPMVLVLRPDPSPVPRRGGTLDAPPE
jgi:hypothetical protein